MVLINFLILVDEKHDFSEDKNEILILTEEKNFDQKSLKNQETQLIDTIKDLKKTKSSKVKIKAKKIKSLNKLKIKEGKKI